jgi:hypothetical protein
MARSNQELSRLDIVTLSTCEHAHVCTERRNNIDRKVVHSRLWRRATSNRHDTAGLEAVGMSLAALKGSFESLAINHVRSKVIEGGPDRSEVLSEVC